MECAHTQKMDGWMDDAWTWMHEINRLINQKVDKQIIDG